MFRELGGVLITFLGIGTLQLKLTINVLEGKTQVAITIHSNYLWNLIAEDSMSYTSKCIIYHLLVFLHVVLIFQCIILLYTFPHGATKHSANAD